MRLGFIFKYTKVTLLLLFVFNITSCNPPSYPKEELVDRLKEMCFKETKINVDAYHINSTLYTYVKVENILDEKAQLSEKALETIQNVVLCANRVSLSTDAKIKFFVVSIFDPNKKFEVVFTQYIEDVRRWILSNISRSDFFSRSLTEFFSHQNEYYYDPAKLTGMSLSEFIVRLILKRSKSDLDQNMVVQVLMNIETVYGFYKVEDDVPFFEYYLTKIEKDKEVSKVTIGNFTGVSQMLEEYTEEFCKKYRFKEYKGIVVKTSDGILFSNI
ncbi:hypothetical protein ACFL4A_01280 [bacterium]